MNDVDTLVGMGFQRNIVEIAFYLTGNQGMETALDWLLTHKDGDGAEVAASAAGASDMVQDEDLKMAAVDEAEVRSLEAKEPLTEDEKKEQLKRVEALVKQRRTEKESKQEAEELEREKRRRKEGQELSLVSEKLAKEELKRLLEIRQREKLDDQMHRQRVLAEIEQDKKVRRERFGDQVPSHGLDDKGAPGENTVKIAKKNYDECRLQIRLTNGDTLQQVFKSSEELAAVRLYVQLNRTDGTGPFALRTNFPKKLFTEDDMLLPLCALDLMPSAVLIVTKPR